MAKELKVAIIGCGLIGQKRAKNLGAAKLLLACDKDEPKAKALGAATTVDWREVIKAKEVEAVIVSTTHDLLAPIALEAVKAGKHVLIEKPGARNEAELRPLAEAARQSKVIVKIGFNHRYHPAFLKAKEILAQGKAGPLMFIRARYGHGGRIGYDKEWRAQKEISGGGELIDQGMHLIDLSRMFLGDLELASSYTPTYFWDMAVEDNAFLMLKSPQGQAAWLHATWTEWKNLFSFEIYARHAKLDISGLGGSYGPEKLVHYQMKPELGPPEAKTYEFPAGDESWKLEFEDFVKAVETGLRPQGDLEDGLAALKIAGQAYERGGA